jgi:hypothetical protein
MADHRTTLGRREAMAKPQRSTNPPAKVIDMLAYLRRTVQADLQKQARDGDEFEQARARQGLIALSRLRRKLDGGKEPA